MRISKAIVLCDCQMYHSYCYYHITEFPINRFFVSHCRHVTDDRVSEQPFHFATVPLNAPRINLIRHADIWFLILSWCAKTNLVRHTAICGATVTQLCNNDALSKLYLHDTTDNLRTPTHVAYFTKHFTVVLVSLISSLRSTLILYLIIYIKN